jgi:hypothetical protein
MPIQHTLLKINTSLISNFAVLDGWFDQPPEMLQRKFGDAWCPAEVLEHVMLTNHFLLMLIERSGDKARTQAKTVDLAALLQDYTFDLPALEDMAAPELFSLEAPERAKPTGTANLHDVRSTLRDQLYRCLFQLDMLCNGEGILCKTMLKVNALGELDVYQYLYFLSLHAQRHCRQLERTTYMDQLARAHVY